MPRKSSKTKQQKLKDSIDLEVKKWMRKNLPLYCATCPYWRRPRATEDLQWGHFITATKAATRWDLKNLAWQCPSCNFQHEHNAYPYTQYMLDTYGREEVDRLQVRSWSREGMKWTVPELEEILNYWLELNRV